MSRSVNDLIKTALVNALAGTLSLKAVATPPSGRTYWSATISIGNSTADNVIQAAGGAGKKHYITGLQIAASGSTATSEVQIKDGSTVIWKRIWSIGASALVPTDATFAEYTLGGSEDTALNVALTAANGSATTYINVQGYTE